MNRRTFLNRVSIAAASLAGLPNPAFAANALRPNIVFILADDLGYGDLGCYNRDSKIPTPNLDALAARGVRFTNAHTPSAVCTPTRYGLLTGRYAWRTRLSQGVLDGFDPSLIEPERVTLPSMLKRAGYATACIGKWHLGMEWTTRDGTTMPFRDSFNGGFRPGREVDFSKPVKGGPLSAGFDYYFGVSGSLDMSPYCFIENRKPLQPPATETPERKDLFYNQGPGVAPAGFELSDVLPELGKRARHFIEKQRGSRNPFFLYLPLTAPHLPVVPSKEFEGRSKAGRYGDFVVELDSVVGSVLQTLKEQAIEQNTLVFFTSDNGGLWHWWELQETDDVKYGRLTPRSKYEKGYGHRSNGMLRGTKADLWDGGHRVPLIVSWPARNNRGQVNQRLVCLTDVISTVAELCNLKLPNGAAEDSVSMAAHLFNAASTASGRDSVVYHSVLGEFAIQKGEWKLILKRGSGGFSVPKRIEPQAGEPAGQLYNMMSDPQETRNVYNQHPELVQSLTELLNECRRGKHTM